MVDLGVDERSSTTPTVKSVKKVTISQVSSGLGKVQGKGKNANPTVNTGEAESSSQQSISGLSGSTPISQGSYLSDSQGKNRKES